MVAAEAELIGRPPVLEADSAGAGVERVADQVDRVGAETVAMHGGVRDYPYEHTVWFVERAVRRHGLQFASGDEVDDFGIVHVTSLAVPWN